jgi:hypothetical protein
LRLIKISGNTVAAGADRNGRPEQKCGRFVVWVHLSRRSRACYLIVYSRAEPVVEILLRLESARVKTFMACLLTTSRALA